MSALRIDVITLFPQLFEAFLGEAFVGIAQRDGVLEATAHNLRDWTTDNHRTVDDSPYGGGAGMVMKPEPLVAAIEEIAGPKEPERRARVIALSPRGRRLDQGALEALTAESHLVLVCGRYEGVDQRVLDLAVDDEISVGDYVLSGGEVPSMLLIEGLVRLLPGVLGNPESIKNESFREDLLEGPHYTRPPEFRGLEVPEVLRSGDHAAIDRWRLEQARAVTRVRRPDLLDARQSNRSTEGEDER